MQQRFFARVLVVSLAGTSFSTATAFAAPAAGIGLASAVGPLSVNGTQVWGNATLFEGTSVRTSEASGDLALRSGVRIQLAAQSQAVVGGNRAVLEKGTSQVNAVQAYAVEARGLRIAADAGSRMLVGLNSSNGVDVTTLSGRATVSDRAGVLLSAVRQGRSVAFAMPQEPQAGATTVTRSGCLLYKDASDKKPHFIMQDDATSEVIELNGPDLALNTGKPVQVTGTPTTAKPVISIATSVMNVNNVAPKGTGGCIAAAQALDAKLEAPAVSGTAVNPPPVLPASTGLSGGAKAAIIIGVAAGGGVGAYLALKPKTSN